MEMRRQRSLYSLAGKCLGLHLICNVVSHYIDIYSPSARWGLRPQAPKVNACKFGDKRNSVTG
ncbi:hypothetical protein J6590_019495 [Homalodisca vitripennis]|nr:hypothetical protein J6590_019495 [Homalodisca vitripennis]